MTRRKTNLFTLDFDLKGVTDVVRLSDGSVAFVRKRVSDFLPYFKDLPSDDL